jgi:hypothetical protein
LQTVTNVRLTNKKVSRISMLHKTSELSVK